MEVSQKARIILESAKIVEKGKKLETRLSRCETIESMAGELVRFEHMGLPTMTPAPSRIKQIYSARKGELIDEEANRLFSNAKSKAALANTGKSKANHANKAIASLRELTSKTHDRSKIDLLIRDLWIIAHRARFDDFIQAAKKAEFKGNMRRALDQYQEALYFVRSDNIDDKLQAKVIAELTNRIERLERLSKKK